MEPFAGWCSDATNHGAADHGAADHAVRGNTTINKKIVRKCDSTLPRFLDGPNTTCIDASSSICETCMNHSSSLCEIRFSVSSSLFETRINGSRRLMRTIGDSSSLWRHVVITAVAYARLQYTFIDYWQRQQPMRDHCERQQ